MMNKKEIPEEMKENIEQYFEFRWEKNKIGPITEERYAGILE